MRRTWKEEDTRTTRQEDKETRGHDSIWGGRGKKGDVRFALEEEEECDEEVPSPDVFEGGVSDRGPLSSYRTPFQLCHDNKGGEEDLRDVRVSCRLLRTN